MITSIFVGFFIVYKVFNLQINFYSMILNIISCFLGIGIYLSIIFIIYSKGEHFADNFKIVFDAIDKISDGDF